MKVGIFDTLSPRRSQFQIPLGYTIDFDGNLDYIEVEESAEDVLIPTFELASNPTIRLSEIRARRFDIVERNSTEGQEAQERCNIESIGFVL